MFLEEYGISFAGAKRDEKAPDMGPFISTIYEEGGTTRAAYMTIFWHGKQQLRVRVKACPSINSVYVHINKTVWEQSDEEFRNSLQASLPDLSDHGKTLVGRISME